MRRSAIAITARAAALICVALFVVGAAGAQTPAGRVVFRGNRGESYEIYSMYANGTDLRNLTNLNWAYDEMPDVSPDGARVVFSSTRDSNAEIYVMNADGSDQRRLTENPAIDWRPKWSPDGSQILFFRGGGRGELWILDVNAMGERRLTESGAAGDWSPDGAFVVLPDPDQVTSDLMTIGADGANRASLGIKGFDSRVESPAWSPDGSQIAFEAYKAGQWDVFTVGSDGGSLENVTEDLTEAGAPAWTPDGARIVLSAYVADTQNLFTMAPDGSDVRRLTDHPGHDSYPSWFGSSDLTRSVSAGGKSPFTWAWLKGVGARAGMR